MLTNTTRPVNMFKLASIFVILACGVFAKPNLHNVAIEKIESTEEFKLNHPNAVARSFKSVRKDESMEVQFGQMGPGAFYIHDQLIASPGISAGVTGVSLNSAGDAIRCWVFCDITMQGSSYDNNITIWEDGIGTKNVTIHMTNKASDWINMMCIFFGLRP